MIKLLALYIGILYSVGLTAQIFNYQPLQSQGDIPRDFIESSSIKYERDLNKISQNRDRQTQQLESKFYLQANFMIDGLLRSGKVVFNDPISSYVGKIADEVLKNNPVLRKKLRFYTIKSPVANAFSTNQGIIFITTGMMAQLENEAQLAFVLSHEISHYTEQHTLSSYLKKEEISRDNRKGMLQKAGDFDETLLKQSFYSRELEFAADEEGGALFLKSNYAPQEAVKFLQVLQYAYLPFDEITFNPAFLASDYLSVPNQYVRAPQTKIVGINADEDDSYSTHPNINKRKVRLRGQFKDIAVTDKRLFLVSEDTFNEVRDLARFELPIYKLQQLDFAAALYDLFLLSRKYPDDLYLKKLTAKTLYIFAKFRNEYETYDPENEDLEGELQTVAYLLEKLPKKELNHLAAAKIWELYQAHPKDQELAKIAEDILVELNVHFQKEFKDFMAAPPSMVAIEEVATAETTVQQRSTDKEYEFLNKVDDLIEVNSNERSRKSDIINQRATEQLQLQYSFATVLDWKVFEDTYTAATEEAQRRARTKDHFQTQEGRRDYARYEKKTAANGVELGIKRVLVVNPFYYKIDLRKKYEGVRYRSSEELQKDYRKRLGNNAKLTGIKYKILDVNDLNRKEIDTFNDIVLLQDWLREQTSYDELSLTSGVRQVAIDALMDKYETDYVVFTGVIDLKDKSNVNRIGATLLISVLFPPYLPFGLINNLRARNEALLMFTVYDVKTGRQQVIKSLYHQGKMDKNLLDMHLYDAFSQVKSEGR